MKKHLTKTNILICLSSVLCLILLFVSSKISYSTNITTNINESVTKHTLTDEEVWQFLESLDDTNNVGNIGLSHVSEEIIIQENNDQQDPEIAIKKQEANKGVAKQSDTKTAVKKYETNETSFGIDVSTWQKDIDWPKVKKSGVSFAMIRAGFRRLDSGEIVMDNKFLDNIKGAIANNINVGVYFFSMAKNSMEALEEAEWLVNVIKNYDITYPVAIDIEIFNQNRLTGVSYSTMTDNALVFCEYVRKKGYTPMIYSYTKALTNYFDTAKFKNERIWLAQYNDEVTYKGKYYMWQYTSSGSVPGITGRVDMNVAYFSVTNDVTKAKTATGINNTGDLAYINFIDMNMDTTLTKEVQLRSSPYQNLPNKAGTLEKGTKIIVAGVSNEYTKIIYNGDAFYIFDTDCFEINKEPIEFEDVEIKAKISVDVTLLKEPYLYLKNNIYKETNDGEIIVTGKNKNFTRIIYEEETYYVNLQNFYIIIEDEEDEETDEEEKENLLEEIIEQ